MRQPVGVALAFATVGASFLPPLCFHETHALLGEAICSFHVLALKELVARKAQDGKGRW